MDVNLQLTLTLHKFGQCPGLTRHLSCPGLALPWKNVDFKLKLGTTQAYFLTPSSSRLEKTKAYARMITDPFPPHPHPWSLVLSFLPREAIVE